MNLKKQVVFPKYQKILEQVGENIKLARKRRKLRCRWLNEPVLTAVPCTILKKGRAVFP